MKLSTKGIDTTTKSEGYYNYFGIPYQHVNRPIHMILELIRSNLLSKPANTYMGLCLIVRDLSYSNIITESEVILTLDYLRNNKPNKHYALWYNKYHKGWRLRWLNKHIKTN